MDPQHIRNHGLLQVVQEWLERVEVKTLFIEPVCPWENGYNESFNGKFKDELLNLEIFYSLKEVPILTQRRRREYHTIRPHCAVGYQSPAPEAIIPRLQLIAEQRR